MASIDIAFCRSLLKLGNAELKKHFPTIRPMIDAWVWNAGHGCWEFHGPKTGDANMPPFYWHGTAGNAYEARYKGWQAWLRVAAATAGIDLEKED